jgi:effector-binding domain-containing protein
VARVQVSVQMVEPRKVAAVRREVTVFTIGAAWRPALDQVWNFLRERSGLHTDGHNIFLYHHGPSRDDPMQVDFGVEVTRPFDPAGEVRATFTPAGEVAQAIHVGNYGRLAETHQAIHDWCAAHGRRIAGKSWEIYGDWTDDESKQQTTVVYLLR